MMEVGVITENVYVQSSSQIVATIKPTPNSLKTECHPDAQQQCSNTDWKMHNIHYTVKFGLLNEQMLTT